jgi:hypothetical protein
VFGNSRRRETQLEYSRKSFKLKEMFQTRGYRQIASPTVAYEMIFNAPTKPFASASLIYNLQSFV